MIGGRLTIRYRPETRSASLDSACRLSRVRALAASLRAVLPICLAALAPFLDFAGSAARSTRATSSSARRAYQTSIVPIVAKPAIASRYAATDAWVAARVSALAKPLLRPAIVKLAAIRFTSYSNGPARVSSKSFRSNSRSRSGEANSPKFDRWASPQSWTSSPAVGVPARSAAMTLAAPR
jgi:hypothetical protein